MMIHASEKKMPLVHHLDKFRTTKIMILYPSKIAIFDSYAVINSTYRAMSAGNRHMKQEKQINQFYKLNNHIRQQLTNDVLVLW